MKTSNLFRPLSALLAVVLFLTVNVVASEQQALQRGCGTPPPSAELVAAHSKAHKGPPRIRGRTTTANSTTAQPNSNSPLAVKVFFHVVSTEDQKGFVNMSMIYEQVCPPSPPSLAPFQQLPSPRSPKPKTSRQARTQQRAQTNVFDRITDKTPVLRPRQRLLPELHLLRLRRHHLHHQQHLGHRRRRRRHETRPAQRHLPRPQHLPTNQPLLALPHAQRARHPFTRLLLAPRDLGHPLHAPAVLRRRRLQHPSRQHARGQRVRVHAGSDGGA